MTAKSNKKHVCLNLIKPLYEQFKDMCESDFINVSSAFNKYMFQVLKERKQKW